MIRIFIICLCVLINSEVVFAQTPSIISEKITASLFNDYTIEKKLKRPFLKHNSTLLAKLNPLGYISSGLLFFYQNIVSEQIQATCQYQISCSENMKLQIKKKGLFIGMMSGLNQLGNCSETLVKDYPRYKITTDGKINNEIE